MFAVHHISTLAERRSPEETLIGLNMLMLFL